MTSIAGAAAALACVFLAAAPAPVPRIDPDAVARVKLEEARALLTKRDFDGAGKAVLEVMVDRYPEDTPQGVSRPLQMTN